MVTYPFSLTILFVLYEGAQIRVNQLLDLVNRVLQNLRRVRGDVEVQGRVPIRGLRTIRIPGPLGADGRPGLFVNLETEGRRTGELPKETGKRSKRKSRVPVVE